MKDSEFFPFLLALSFEGGVVERGSGHGRDYCALTLRFRASLRMVSSIAFLISLLSFFCIQPSLVLIFWKALTEIPSLLRTEEEMTISTLNCSFGYSGIWYQSVRMMPLVLSACRRGISWMTLREAFHRNGLTFGAVLLIIWLDVSSCGSFFSPKMKSSSPKSLPNFSSRFSFSDLSSGNFPPAQAARAREIVIKMSMALIGMMIL